MDKIEKVIVKYISGREEVLEGAILAGRRIDWLENKNVELLGTHEDPPLRISKFGDEIIFETGQGKKIFKNMEELGGDLYYSKLYEIYT